MPLLVSKRKLLHETLFVRVQNRGAQAVRLNAASFSGVRLEPLGVNERVELAKFQSQRLTFLRNLRELQISEVMKAKEIVDRLSDQ